MKVFFIHVINVNIGQLRKGIWESILGVNIGVLLYECDVCEYKTDQKLYLKKHIGSVHKMFPIHMVKLICKRGSKSHYYVFVHSAGIESSKRF